MRMHLQGMVQGADCKPFLINASPDLRAQIESEPILWPDPNRGPRNTPIAGIVLTSADLDQVLGLLLLREFQPLVVYATSAVRRTLEANSFFRMMERVPNQLTWVEMVPGQPFALGEGIVCTPIPLAGSLPFYAGREAVAEAGQATIGLLLESEGQRVAFTPSLPAVTDELRAMYDASDLILVDGTFWSDAELSDTHRGTPRARAIGHVPVGGADGSVAELASVTGPRKVFLHINNTNPMLDPESAERRWVEAAGWQVAEDGWEFSFESMPGE